MTEDILMKRLREYYDAEEEGRKTALKESVMKAIDDCWERFDLDVVEYYVVLTDESGEEKEVSGSLNTSYFEDDND